VALIIERLFFGANMSKFRYLLFIVLFFPLLANGGVESIEVNVQGEGNSYQQALNNALLEAVGQIHGKSIDSQKMTLSIEASSATNESEEYYSSDAYLSVVKEKTKGQVSSYKVLDADDSSGRWILDVVAQVAKFKKSKSADRKRIVIAQSKVGQNTFSVLGQNINAQKVAEKMDQSMSDGLVQTRKFAILDRQNNAAVDSELTLAASDRVSTEEAARIGQSLVSDFVLVGTLDRVQYSTTTKKMLTSDRTYTTGSGDAAFSYSFIEVATSQIFFSDTVKASISHNEISRAERNKPDLVSDALIEALSNKLVKVLVDQIYPLAIISRRNGEVILSEGGKRLSVGDSYKVYKRGDKIYDPYTKEFSGYEEFYCCTVQVNRVGPKQSYAAITAGEEAVPATVPARIFVLREKISKAKPKLVKSKTIPKEDNDW
jgi:hypothetical protein